jgi:hypothetical protein
VNIKKIVLIKKKFSVSLHQLKKPVHIYGNNFFNRGVI